MKSVRTNKTLGYRYIYKPEHPTSMNSENWDGYIYEHIYIIEKNLGRSLTENEIVHHLDNNPNNNKIENLIVLDKSQHAKIHAWVNKMEQELKNGNLNIFNKELSFVSDKDICKICEITLQKDQTI